MKRFAEYKEDGHNWITLTTGEYYPDVLVDACLLYSPVLEMFGRLLRTSESSIRLLQQISEIREGWMRIQLCRVFKRYVSPATPVEMLKKKSKILEICQHYGNLFRPVQEVQQAFNSRPIPDEPLCALLWEYKERGKKGYDLTERFFEMFRSRFPQFPIEGPERSGQDIRMGKIFPDYPKPSRPVDFIVYSEDRKVVLSVGFARYDSDRGGSQEDDRTGGYRECAKEILAYAKHHHLPTKILFINDGPGLLLGSMWEDYAQLENINRNRIMVVTLRMIPTRLTREWLLG